MGCKAADIDNTPVKAFDLQRFLGSWYEVARYDHWFERDMQQTKATYKLREDGKIEVLNTGFKNGKPKDSKGKAKTTETVGLLRVSFFGPFYSDYRILLIDKTISMPSSAAAATATSGSSRASLSSPRKRRN